MEVVEKFEESLRNSPIVIIYRGFDAEECLELTQVLVETGIRFFEVTMNTPYALHTIEMLRQKMNPEIHIGAGTVLTPEEVLRVSDAGAGFVISPNVDEEVIKATKQSGMVSIPGAFTPTEVVKAWNLGADIVKVFPINVVGSEYIKQLRGPIANIPFMATGGVQLEMVGDLFREGVHSLGLGVHLLGREFILKKDWKGLQSRALQFLEATGCNKEGVWNG